MLTRLILSGLLLATPLSSASAEETKILHIYSSRHYDSDQVIYDKFAEMSGVEVKVVEGKDDALIARLEQEGMNSPADILITADAGRLWRAENAGLFQATNNEELNTRIPANFRDANGHWYGFTKRARAIVYNKNKIQPEEIQNYSDLADPKLKGKICIRSSSNIYNLSLLASFIELKGANEAKNWAQGLLANLARKPQGGDTDQIRAVHAGACDIAVANSYYYGRLMRSDKTEDQAVIKDVAILFPDQEGMGTHVNVSGAGILKSSNQAKLAEQFLTFMASDEVQSMFSDGNNEYPVVVNIEPNDTLKSLGEFKEQNVNVRTFGVHQKDAQKTFDEISFF